MEGLGLGIFMVSATFFTAMLEHPASPWHTAIPNGPARHFLIALMMGLTALFIFYSPVTAPSGAHINPAVTLVQWRVGNIHKTDALFYMVFQLAGGTVFVYIMAFLLGSYLTSPPVNYVVTVPGMGVSVLKAFSYELVTSFIMITMILHTAGHPVLKKYTRLFAGILVFCYVMVGGPVSGFGMNPARSFASALPANIWTSFWIYIICPFAGMLGAAEVFLWMTHTDSSLKNK